MVRQIKDILSTDITSQENQEKLEEFKRDASAYGEQPQQPLCLQAQSWMIFADV